MLLLWTMDLFQMNEQSHPICERHHSLNTHDKGQSTGFMGMPGDIIATGWDDITPCALLQAQDWPKNPSGCVDMSE